MVSYPLAHLTQDDSQSVSGPIQDDEALALFALIRCMRLQTVVEIGGLSGYSARNFCEAVGPLGRVITLDLNPVPQVAPNHVTIIGDATKIGPKELQVEHIDLVFFDCHEYDAQMKFLNMLTAERLIDDESVIALHDTNTHPHRSVSWKAYWKYWLKRMVRGPLGYEMYLTPDGWVHQDVERRMVNDLKMAGYDALCLHSKPDRHDDTMPYRHGLTIMKKFNPLRISADPASSTLSRLSAAADAVFHRT
jgi:predicted O-methyltransferase YrrM